MRTPKFTPLIFSLFFIMIINTSAHADFRLDLKQDAKTLQNLAQNKDLRVFWWNIHHGQTNLKKPNSDFTQNLKELITSDSAPDIISMAEYSDADLNFNSLDLLPLFTKNYPYRKFVNYLDTPDQGVVTFSKYPLTEITTSVLDFTPIQTMTLEEKKNYIQFWCGNTDTCTRKLQILSVTVNEEKVILIPIHLYDCWRKFKVLHGRMKTLAEILGGTENPLYYQTQRLFFELQKKIPSELKTPHLLLYGDFNMPNELLKVPTMGYSLFTKKFNSALTKDFEHAPTFPAKNSEEAKSFPKMQIDHGFLSPGTEVSAGTVVSLKGSDHYPLYFILKTKKELHDE